MAGHSYRSPRAADDEQRVPSVSPSPAEDETLAHGNAAALEQLGLARDAEPGPLTQARSELAEIRRNIVLEDADRGRGHRTKRPDETVAAQVARELAAALAAEAAAQPNDSASIQGLVTAVASLRTAWEQSTLVATDTAEGLSWTADESRCALGDPDAARLMARWQAATGYVKFAVVRGEDGPIVRVGDPAVYSHGEVGGGPAISAGLVEVDADRHEIAQLENVSGGYRPGPMRNATAKKGFEAEGWRVRAVHASQTGGYDDSVLAG